MNSKISIISIALLASTLCFGAPKGPRVRYAEPVGEQPPVSTEMPPKAERLHSMALDEYNSIIDKAKAFIADFEAKRISKTYEHLNDQLKGNLSVIKEKEAELATAKADLEKALKKQDLAISKAAKKQDAESAQELAQVDKQILAAYNVIFRINEAIEAKAKALKKVIETLEKQYMPSVK